MIPRKIFFTGNSGSGKSTLIDHLTYKLESWGYNVSFLVDRVGLEGSVIADAVETTGGFSKNTTHLIGDGRLSNVRFQHDEHYPYFHNFKTTLLGAEILNEPKITMVEAVAKMPLAENDVVMAEWTTGLRVAQKYLPAGHEDLLQDSQFFAELLLRNGLFGDSFVLETFAPMGDRLVWNAARGEHAIEQEEYKKLFPDGDRMPDEIVASLGNRYYFFDNSGSDTQRFRRDADSIFHDILVPRLGFYNIYENGLPRQSRR